EGGSEMMFRSTVSLLERAGHEVYVYERDNHEVANVAGGIRAAASGIYSLNAKREIARLIETAKPEVVHAHNLYPLVSPSILDACQRASIPVVMRLADFTLLCPTSHHFRNGAQCERCLGGREYHCVLTNCRGNILMSAAYALRTMVARLRRCFLEKVELFAAPTNFVRQRFIAEGFPAERIVVLPNVVQVPDEAASPSSGEYAAYVGRLSPEKGLGVLLDAARMTKLPVRIAGDAFNASSISEGAPDNVQFIGRVGRGQLGEFLRRARFVVVPSLCFESFNLVCAEAMAHGLPVIASRIGGLAEIVNHMETGMLFNTGDAEELAQDMRRLWQETETVVKMGEAARRKAIAQYSPEVHYSRLLKLYGAAIESCSRRTLQLSA
ncbi:MAG: hypothetical protein QOD00_430, partial [Blastocatellia bacterium]|nr:hypothetical protein [Blastocatellia bacterium]